MTDNPTAVSALVALAVLGVFLLVTVLKTLYTVRTYTAGVVERFGKFSRITRPGLHALIPFAERVYFVDLQVKQAQFSVETKTRDNVFVQIPVSVQYQVLEDRIFDAFYKLSAPQKQIESFVFNSILGHVPKLTLDETFEQQSGISVAVKVELDQTMNGFGFIILTALVTDIIPDIKVKAAMNDINAAQRAQVAAQARGEAEKILKVKAAEAEAESKALQGNGIARERQAIIDGLSSSIEHFQHGVPGSTPEEVMALVLLTQYFDTLRDVGTRGGTNTLFLPNNPGASNDFMVQILAGLRADHLPKAPGPDAARTVRPARPEDPPAPPPGTPGTPDPYASPGSFNPFDPQAPSGYPKR
jgi:regulator of protease activity HflC (stomatin/prohibitin superfamily)